MKKTASIILLILVSTGIFFLGFTYDKTVDPKTYFQVYLDDKIIGIVDSSKKLENYIDKQNSQYKKKYGVSKIYAPKGLEIKAVNTYNGKIDNVNDIYNKLKEEKPFTIDGYQLTIQTEVPQVLFAMKEEVFKTALEETAKIYAGEEKYEAYKTNTQSEISTTGEVIENVYIEENMTIKKTKISIEENIFLSEKDLTAYLLFGKNNEKKEYAVQVGDTIEKVAMNNEISVSEFLMSNPNFSNKNNLLFPGQLVSIGITNPQIKVVVEKYVVADIESEYKTEEKLDLSKNVGYRSVVQNGEKGLERVSRSLKVINGVINYADFKSKEILKPAVNEIILLGNKKVTSYGNLDNWGWPTDSGWMITENYEYRINPVSGGREFHQALDISGTGYGSNIYASNNGTVETSNYHNQYGYYVVINHNNGYSTLYAHMARPAPVNVGETVYRGQVIGYMGSTGWSTGPHLHYEVWVGKVYQGRKINPWDLYR